MNKEEQIEEMAKVYEEARLKANETLGSMNKGAGNWYAEAFYNAGYRKADEIFEEIEESIKAAVAALQFKNNPIHRQVKHETYSSLMRFIKTVQENHTERRTD